MLKITKSFYFWLVVTPFSHPGRRSIMAHVLNTQWWAMAPSQRFIIIQVKHEQLNGQLLLWSLKLQRKVWTGGVGELILTLDRPGSLQNYTRPSHTGHLAPNHCSSLLRVKNFDFALMIGIKVQRFVGENSWTNVLKSRVTAPGQEFY
jgi:hypothetical protein